MTEIEITTTLAQFGAAGMMGWMWLSERRAAAGRERQLTEAHERIVSERTGLSVLLRAIEANTRALAGIEAGQRELLGVLTAWRTRPARRRAAPPAPSASNGSDQTDQDNTLESQAA